MKFHFKSMLVLSGLCALASRSLAAVADDSVAHAISSAVVTPANGALRGIMAQAVPIGEPEKPLSAPGLPTGLNYTVDLSAAFPYGDTGGNSRLPGGTDAVLGYGFNKQFRVQAGYYELQEYPIGFNTGVVPVNLQGFGPPVGVQNLANVPSDVAVKNKVFTANLQTLFLIGKKLPVIFTPTYISRRGTVGGHTDETLVEINGFPQTVHTRTVQSYILPLTLPFLATPRMFGTLTAGPTWNVNTNGANAAGNSAQIFELA